MRYKALAAIAAIGTTLALPGLGLLIAGPIAAALVGAGSGAAAGGVLGALAAMGSVVTAGMRLRTVGDASSTCPRSTVWTPSTSAW